MLLSDSSLFFNLLFLTEPSSCLPPLILLVLISLLCFLSHWVHYHMLMSQYSRFCYNIFLNNFISVHTHLVDYICDSCLVIIDVFSRLHTQIPKIFSQVLKCNGLDLSTFLKLFLLSIPCFFGWTYNNCSCKMVCILKDLLSTLVFLMISSFDGVSSFNGVPPTTSDNVVSTLGPLSNTIHKSLVPFN